MPNNYFTAGFTGQPRGLAKVEQMDALESRVEAAFDKVPEERELREDRVTAVTATTSNGQAFTVTMDPAPTAYTDGMALNVRFPQVSEANPTLDILDENSMSLGAKPIRDVNGQALAAAHIAANVRAELYYVDHGTGYWILGAGGARGTAGPPGPPDGEFYVLSGTTQLGFRDTAMTPVANFGQIAMRYRDAYDNATAYVFNDVVLEGGKLYWHFGLDETTGDAVTDTTVWTELVPSGFKPGDMKEHAGTTVEAGWLQCDGAAVSRTTYSALFSAIGTAWGTGDGSTTFNLPDFRRRVAVGSGGTGTTELGADVGDTGGAETATAPLPAHTHGAGTLATGSAGSHTHAHGLSVGTGGSHTHGAGTLAAASAGAHTHSASVAQAGTNENQNSRFDSRQNSQGSTLTTSSAGAHAHTISGSTASGGSHSHTLSGSISSAGAHTHTISGSTASAGPGGTHNNIQPSAVVLRIIKT